MNTLKKILVSLITVLMLLTSCTDPVDTTPKGALIVEVGTYEGAASYKAMIDNKPVDIVEGKAIIISDAADYDVYVTALDKDGKVIADFYKRVPLNSNDPCKVELTAIDNTRNFFSTIMRLNLPNSGVGDGSGMPYVRIGGIGLDDTNNTFTKIVVEVDAATLFPVDPEVPNVYPSEPGLPSDEEMPVQPTPSIPSPEDFIDIKNGTFTVVDDIYTLTGEAGYTENLKMVDGSLVSQTEPNYVYGSLVGTPGGSVEGEYWSLPVSVLSKDAINQIVNMMTESGEVKNPVTFTEDILLDAGLCLKNGQLEIYFDIHFESDYLDSTVTCVTPTNAGIRINMPLEYSEIEAGVYKVGLNPFGIVGLKRWAGGSILELSLDLIPEEEPLPLILARNYTGKDIEGDTFTVDTSIDLGETVKQIKEFVTETKLKDRFESEAVSKVYVGADSNNKGIYKSIMGNWTCDDSVGSKFNISTSYFKVFSSEAFGKSLTVKYRNYQEPVEREELIFVNDEGKKTIVRADNIKITGSTDYTVDKFQADVSIVDAKGTVIEGAKSYSFTRTDFEVNPDVYESFNELMAGNLMNVSLTFGKDGRYYVTELGEKIDTGLRYMKTEDRILLYMDDLYHMTEQPEVIVPNPDELVRAFRAVSEPAEPNIKISVYFEYPFEETAGIKKINLVKSKKPDGNIYSIILK